MGENKAEPARSVGPPQPLKLQRAESDTTYKHIADILKAERPTLGADGDDASDPQVLAASFCAYADGRELETKQHWTALLLEVLNDSGATLDDDDNESAAQRVVNKIVEKGVLKPTAHA